MWGKKDVVSFCHAHWEYSIIALIHLRYWFFNEHISLFICLQLQNLQKEELFQPKVLPCEMPVKVVACVVLPSIEGLI